MRLHELVPKTGAHIVHHDESDQTLVLCSSGALFLDEDTEDMTHMCVAFGLITTSNEWRLASAAEIAELRRTDATRDLIMRLEWVQGAFSDPPRPHLTLVR